MKSIGRLLLIGGVSAFIGRSVRLIAAVISTADKDHKSDLLLEMTGLMQRTDWKETLRFQMEAQQEMQQLIGHTQNPQNCAMSRILASALEYPKDGFASEFQYVARLLQMAVSTQRVLVFSPEWKSAYEPPGCRSNEQNNLVESSDSSWTCLWEKETNCSWDELQALRGPVVPSNASSLASGIIRGRRSSQLFDVGYYGERRTAWSPVSFPNREPQNNLRADVIAHWERAFGRFWVRAQMVHFLWNPNAMLQEQIRKRTPPEIEVGPFIGFHVRLTDNVKDLTVHFARNATQCRSFERFMTYAGKIRLEHPSMPLNTIYLATDNLDVVTASKALKWRKLGWRFISQQNVERTNSQERLWFSDTRYRAAGAIATDLHILRRADFLVGSFQSNVYRLAAQLNTVWHCGKYPLEIQRHFSVDVEWYEDP